MHQIPSIIKKIKLLQYTLALWHLMHNCVKIQYRKTKHKIIRFITDLLDKHQDPRTLKDQN